MKKILYASIAVMLGAYPALAADLSTRPVYKAPMSVPVVYNWTGFYIGGHVGYGWADSDWTQTVSSFGLTLDRSVTSQKADGFLGGGQIGYNWQAGMWVFGVEGDWSWTDANGCSGHTVFVAYSGCTNNNWYATVAGRLGVAFDRTLIYAKGGAAFADQDHLITFNGVTTTNNPGNTRTGWVVGGGVEYAIWDNWSVKVEYNYLNFGKDTTTFTYTANPPGLSETWKIDQTVQVVKFGVNYRFNWGAPVVANY